MTLADICRSRLHCRTCRKPIAGAGWRQGLVAAGVVAAVQFDCPETRPWAEEGRMVAARELSSAPAALRRCGPFWADYRRVEKTGPEMLRQYARQLAWIAERPGGCRQARLREKLLWYEKNICPAA